MSQSEQDYLPEILEPERAQESSDVLMNSGPLTPPLEPFATAFGNFGNGFNENGDISSACNEIRDQQNDFIYPDSLEEWIRRSKVSQHDSDL